MTGGCTNLREHGPHNWFGAHCAGVPPIDALTLSQVDAIADALHVSPWLLAGALKRD